MRVIIEVPEKYLSFAAGMLLTKVDDREDILDAIVENCKGKDIEVNIKDLDLDKSETFQMNIAMAMMAIIRGLEDMGFNKKGEENENS